MRKTFFFIVLIFGMLKLSFGQHYQLPNNQFNSWLSSTPRPSNWYTYGNADHSVSDAVWTALQTAGMLENHHAEVVGRIGAGSACQIYTIHKSVMGHELDVNGAISTGRPMIGSLSLSNDSNYVYSEIHGSCKWSFQGRPDSISLWTRFSFFQNEHPSAMLRVHIHGNVEYKDIASHNANTAQAGKIANAYCELINPATTPNANGVYKSGWTRFAFKFKYWDENNNPISQPTLNNTQSPSYILASLSTNKLPNVGNKDSLAFDDIFCIYDKSLASLKIDGIENNTIREYFNDHEYITHEKTTNIGDITYEYNDLICYHNNQLPQVSATAKSSLILSITITQATLDNPYATILVTHNDNSTYEYKIHFKNMYPAVEAILNEPSGSYIACSDEVVTVTASGAPSYIWNTGETTATIHPTSTGTYVVTATNGHCTAINTAYVTIHTAPTATITGNTSFCSGGSTTLTAGGANNYLWSYNNATSQSINVNAGGTYTVTVTSSEGCSDIASVTVTEKPLPTLTITGPEYLCSGTTDTVTVSGADHYNWSWNGGSSTDSILPITASGTYNVTGTNAQGCSKSGSITVDYRTSPSVSISGVSQLCEGSSATLTASATQPGTTFLWADNTQGSTLAITAGGTYSVTALLDGCRSTAEKTVVSLTRPDSPTATSNSNCGPGTVTLSATSAPGTICHWYSSNSSSQVLGTGNDYTTPPLSQDNTYYVSAQNADGCFSDRVPVTAYILDKPMAPTVSPVSFCGAQDYTLTATSSNPIQWYSDAYGNDSITANQHITETTTYYVAAIGSNQCRSDLRALTVTINQIPGVPTVTQPAPLCSNSNVDIALSATPDNDSNSIQWYNSSMTLIGSAPEYTARNISTSTVVYAATYDPSTHCESEKVPVYITKNNLPEAPTLSCEPRCGAGSITLYGNANGLIVKWYDANDNHLDNGGEYSANITTSTIFKAKAYNSETTCESNYSSITAVVNPEYSDIHDTKAACGSYTWAGKTYTVSGNYTETLQSSKGCDSTVTLHLTINNGFNDTFDTTVCGQFVWDGTTYTTSGSDIKHYTSKAGCDSTVTYHFTIKQPTQSTQTLTLCSNETPYYFLGTYIENSGTYTVHTTNVAGCDSTITLNVTVYNQPSTPTVTNRTNCGAKSLTLSSATGSDGTTCRWYMDMETDTYFKEGNSLTQNFTESVTYYVSSYNTTTGCESGRVPVSATINPVPDVPQVTHAARCGSGNVTLGATAGENATTCRWYGNDNINNTTVLETGPSFTILVNSTRNYFVESYNENTNCKSSRVAVTATINSVPAVPQVTSNITHCDALSADLTDYVSGSSSYRWYDENNSLLNEGEHYETSIEETTVLQVSAYNNETSCESAKGSLTITINPNYEPQTIFDTICQNTHYQEYSIDSIFEEGGDLEFVINQKASTDCDSLVTLHLHVKPQVTHEFTVVECDAYDWDNSHYTQSGDYVKVYTAANNCDSIVTLHLTINPSRTFAFDAEACNSYTWNGHTYTESGNYVQTFTTSNHCDSTVTLHLTIHASRETEFFATACDSYTWNDQTYYESGEYTQSFTTIHNCDSTVTLQLTIYPSYHINLNENICFNRSYDFNGKTLTESGVYTDTLKSIHQCDSIITLNLNVYPEYRDTITANVCLDSSYNDHGFIIPNATETQYYTHTFPDVHNCDSTTVLYLIVNQPASTTFNATLCQGGHYTENGFNFSATEAGTFTERQNLTTSMGCDSIVTLNVTVNPAYHSTLSADICQGESYSFNGMTLTETGTYADTTTTDLGCDSIITLYLTVHQPAHTDFYTTLCLGESYTEHGFNFLATEVGSFSETQQLTTVFHCDSIVTLHITVNPTHITTFTADICSGEVYNENGFIFNETQPGNYNRTLNLKNQFDCDSIVTLNITVHPNKQIVLSDQICAGQRYQKYGFDTVFNRASTYTLTHHDNTVFDCDSITILTIVVFPVRQNHIYEHTCYNNSYDFNGTLISTSGIYTDTLSTVNGCDSIVTLHLTVYPERRDTVTAHTCSGVDYVGYGFNIENPLVTDYHSHTNTDVNGCDSTKVLHLYVESPVTTELTDTICQYELYDLNGFNFYANEVGTSVRTLNKKTSFGCDSTVSLQITVNPVFETTYTADGCRGVPFSFFGFDTTINTVGQSTLTHIYQSQYGCDSIVHLNINIHSEQQTLINEAICANETYDFNGKTLTQSGTYRDTLHTSFECDSIVILQLYVRPEQRDTLLAETCYDVPYSGHGFYIEHPTATDFYSHPNTDVNGCDSTTVLHLIVHENKTTNLTDTICFGMSYTLNGFNISNPNVGDSIYTRLLTTRFGCDSTVKLHLIVNPTHYMEFSDEVCAGTAYHGYGFDTLISQGGIHTLTKHEINQYGCDSTVVLLLNVYPTYQTNISSTICESGSYNFNGLILTEGGIYTMPLQSVHGCDSSVTLNLTVAHEYRDTITAHICEGQIYNNYGFNILDAQGGEHFYSDSTQSLDHCDSTVVLHLFVHELNTTNLYDTICAGNDYNNYGFNFPTNAEGDYTFSRTVRTSYECDSTVNLYLHVKPSYHLEYTDDVCVNQNYNQYGFDTTFSQTGTFILTHNNTSVNGCDSTTILNLNVHPEYHLVFNETTCYNEAFTFEGNDYNQSGTYTFEYHTKYGCDSILTLNLTVYPEKRDSLEAHICFGESYEEYGFNILHPTETGYHEIHHTDVNGCDSTTVLHLFVHPVKIIEYYDTVCQFSPYQEHGFDAVTTTTAGDFIYTNEGETSFLCDSIVKLYLTVQPVQDIVIFDEICAGEVYSLLGFDTVFAQPGEYTLQQQSLNEHGCDSTTTVYLSVHPVYHQEVSASTCFNRPYSFNGRSLNVAGTYTDTLHTIHHCDSIITLHLEVYPEKRDTLEAHICEGDSYFEEGFSIYAPSETDYYSISSSDVNGCDSTTVLHLYVHPYKETFIHETICLGDRYTDNGFDELASVVGTFNYTLPLHTSYGCDSTVTLQLTVNPKHQIVYYDTVCSGEPYSDHGFDTLISQAGLHSITHQDDNVFQCDSITILNLYVLPSYHQIIPKMICENSSYYFNGQDITEAGIYTADFTTAMGCDSVVTLILSVGAEFRDTITDHICAGQSYNKNGFSLDKPMESGFHSINLQSINECDSIVVLYLTVFDTAATEFDTTVCNSFSWNNTVYTSSGDYLQHFSTVNGCDSIVTVHLTVNYSEVSEFDTVVCGSFTWNDSVYTSSNDYVQVLSNRNGCDSTVTVHLTVNYAEASEFDTVVCESFTWNDSVYTSSNDYVQVFSNRNGCDSIVTVHLIVNPSETFSFDTTVCEAFTWNDSIYTVSDTYSQSFINRYGCDSTVTVNLTVHHAETSEFDTVVCDSFTWNDSVYTSSNDYVQVLSNRNGCDSTVTVHLTVNYAEISEFDTVVCESFTWNDSVYTTSNDYVQVFPNRNGCDSIVTVHLTVNHAEATEFDTVVCHSFIWNDSVYTSSNDYVQVFFNQNGCDSIVTVHLTVNNTLVSEDHVVICDDELPYTYIDTVFDYGTTGLVTKVFNLHTLSGCDSIVTLFLTVKPTFERDTTVDICDVDIPFLWGGEESELDFWTAGDHDIPYTTVSGCDSTIHLHLNVHQTYNQDTLVSICNGALPYEFCQGYTFTEGGDYTVTLQTVNGCDSIWNLELNVIPNLEHTASQTICDNELPYIFLGDTFHIAGYYDIIGTDDNNCLTITHFTLNVNPTYHGYDTMTVCQEDLPAIYGDSTLYTAGIHDVHFRSGCNCDSLVTLLLNVTPTALGADTLHVCSGDFPITYNEMVFNSAGVYTVTFEREGFCDSLVTLNLIEAERFVFTDTVEVCDHTLPYLWRNRSLTQSGFYYDSLRSIYGCDSVFVLNLTVNQTQIVVSDPIVLCNGESETWRGMSLSQTGIYRDTVLNETTGCQIIHEVNVTVHPTYTFHDSVSVCSDDLPFFWRGRYLSDAGTYEVVLQTAETYCDSTYRMTLFVSPSHHVTETVSVCDYDIPYLWHGESLSVTGTYFDTIRVAGGCDSTFTLSFIVNPSQHILSADTVCDSSLPYLWRGYPITAAGVYRDTVANSFGCMDVFELDLHVNASDVLTLRDTVCEGALYSRYGFDTLASQAGTLYLHQYLSNADGCDSTVNLVLSVLPAFRSETSGETCLGTPFEWRGFIFDTEGTYFDSLVASTGCDSVYVLHLSVNPTYDIYVSDTTMREHEYNYDSFVITPADSGSFHYDIQYYTLAGCDSVVHLTLYVEYNYGVEEHTLTTEFKFFPNPTNAVLNIKGEQMRQVRVYDLNGKLVRMADADSPESSQIDVSGFATGHYLVRVLLDNGQTVTRKIVVKRW